TRLWRRSFSRPPRVELQAKWSIVMAFFTVASKADFQHHLQTALAQHVSEQALPQVALFAEQFFGIIALDELTQRRLSDLVGCTLSSWRVLERFESSKPEVRVFN